MHQNEFEKRVRPTMASVPSTPQPQAGNWTKLEQFQFEEGVIAHGWGNWSRMVKTVIPTRNRNQVKSHAQKFRRAHPEIFEELLLKHSKLHRKREAIVTKAGSGAAMDNAAEGVAKKGTKSSSPPRRRASMIKAKTPALARSSPRRPRRFSAPGSIELMANHSSNVSSTPARGTSFTISSSRKKNAKIQSSSPYSPPQSAAAPSPTSNQDVILSGVLSDMCSSVAPSMSALFTEFLSSPPRHSPHYFMTNTSSSHEDDPIKIDDELATLAARVTFSSDPFFTLDKLVSEASESSETLNSDTPLDYLLARTNQNFDATTKEAMVDPLLDLSVDDFDLESIFDLFGASSGSTSGRNEQNVSAISHSIFLARPNPHILEPIRSMLLLPTDYNDPKEYKLAADGVSRTGLHRGAVSRARIKKLLCDHLNLVWWNADAAVNHIPAFDTCAGVIQTALDAYCSDSSHDSLEGIVDGGEEGKFKRFAFECFVALSAAMLDTDVWRTPWIGDPITFVGDVEDIRDVGHLVHRLWGSMKNSLQSDCTLHVGDKDELAERKAAISSIVDRLEFICRLDHIHSKG